MNPIYAFTHLIVALSTWLTPMPSHAEGILLLYGSQRLVELNAEYRGYDLTPYRDRCGLSTISPSDLGKIVWIKTGSGWYGPCPAVDVAATRDFYKIVYETQEVAELARPQMEMFGKLVTWGEVFVGNCPDDSVPSQLYRPPLELVKPYREPSMWPYPAQQIPSGC